MDVPRHPSTGTGPPIDNVYAACIPLLLFVVLVLCFLAFPDFVGVSCLCCNVPLVRVGQGEAEYEGVIQSLRGVLEGLKGKAKPGKALKRFIPVLEKWIATPPTIIHAVVDGVTKVGALMDKDTVKQMGDDYMSNHLKLLRTCWKCVLFKDGSPARGTQWDQCLLIAVPKTESASLVKQDFVAQVELARPQPPPGPSYASEAKAKHLEMRASCEANVLDNIHIDNSVVEQMQKLEAYTNSNLEAEVAVQAVLKGYLRPVPKANRPNPWKTSGVQFQFVRRAFCRIWNVLRDLLHLGENDKARPFTVHMTNGSVWARLSNDFNAATELHAAALPMFVAACQEKDEKKPLDSGEARTLLNLRDLLFHLLSKDNLSSLLAASARDTAATSGHPDDTLMALDPSHLDAASKGIFHQVHAIQEIARVLASGWSQTLLEWANALIEAIKSAYVKRANGDVQAKFPGWRSIRATDTVPFATIELGHVIAFLGVRDRLVLHGSGFPKAPLTVGDLRAHKIGSRFTIVNKFRRNGSRALKIYIPRTASATPPKVRVATGDASAVSIDPGVRVALTAAVMSVDAPKSTATVTIMEMGRNILNEKMLVDHCRRRGVAAAGQHDKISVAEILHREDRLKSVIAQQEQLRKTHQQQEEQDLLPMDWRTEENDEGEGDGEGDGEGEDDGAAAEEHETVLEQLEQLEQQFQAMDHKRKHPGLAAVAECAQKRYERNKAAREQAGQRERTFLTWLRLDTKRKRRALKQQRERLSNFMMTQKRNWAAQIVKAAGAGGVVITPKLNFHAFKRARISRRVRRSLQVLAHCSFVDHELRDACRAKSVLLVVTGEAHTTKTCCACFAANNKVGASEVFKCPACHYEAPRDGKAALSIQQRLLAHL